VRLARGEDVREVEAYREAVSYSEENTFASDVADRDVLEATLIAHAESVARRLRRDGLAARTVVLKLKLGRRREAGPRGYPIFTRRTTLREATDDGAVLSAHASELLGRFGLDEPIRLIGVGATNLVPSESEQFGLFDTSDGRSERKRLNRALDEIRDRFGSDAVLRGGTSEAERAGLSMQIKRGE
jgi:DNA polymerase-4